MSCVTVLAMLAMLAPSSVVASQPAEGGGSSGAEREVPFQMRSLSLGLGSGLQAGLDFYSELGRFDADVYLIPNIGGDCQGECWNRTHGELTWSPSARAGSWVQGGLDVGLAAGHRKEKSLEGFWSGPAVGPLFGVHGSLTPLDWFGLGLELGVAPVYWARNSDPETQQSPSRIRMWLTGALSFQFGSVRRPAW